MSALEPRVAPGRRSEIGVINWLVCRALSRGAGVPEAKLFSTVGRNRRVFKAWLIFSASLMPGGTLGRRATEAVILRVAHVQGSVYEQQHHERLGRRVGLSAAQVEATRTGPSDPVWAPALVALLAATDELLGGDDITEPTWRELRRHWGEPHVIELCLLVGQYRGLATTIKALRIQPDN